MYRLLCALIVFFVGGTALAQENPLKKCSRDDWAKYLITTKNETVPLMSTKDRPNWRVVSNVGDGFVRVDNYTLFGGRRSGAGGNLWYYKDRYEPVAGIAKSAKVEVVSTSQEKLIVGGKQYTCTKVVRKIDQPLDESKVQSSWVGTSTLWICEELPLGLAKMENVYQTRLSKSDKGQKISETWNLAEFGFKNWK